MYGNIYLRWFRPRINWFCSSIAKITGIFICKMTYKMTKLMYYHFLHTCIK